MDDHLRAAATEIAGELKTEILAETLVVIEVIYYAYKLFQTCHTNPATVKAELEASYNGQEFSRHTMRPAIRQVMRSARHNKADLSDVEIEKAAKAMLLKAMNAEDGVVSACYVS